jgi:hypothetical protein
VTNWEPVLEPWFYDVDYEIVGNQISLTVKDILEQQ